MFCLKAVLFGTGGALGFVQSDCMEGSMFFFWTVIDLGLLSLSITAEKHKKVKPQTPRHMFNSVST